MSGNGGRPPVDDWSGDYDIFHSEYITDPAPIWDDLRQRCPIAHTERWGGSWLPTRYEDVRALARLVPELSSTEPLVVKPPPLPSGEYGGVVAPPISIDPPAHGPARRLILPAFSPQAVDSHEPFTRQLAHRLIDAFVDRGQADAAVEYAQQIPPRVIAHLLGVDQEQADTFVVWARGLLEQGLTDPEIRFEARRNILGFFTDQVAQRRAEPREARGVGCPTLTSSPTCWPASSKASRCRTSTSSAPASCCW